VLVAAALGFAAGGVLAFLIGFVLTSGGECDGPCFTYWNEVIVAAAVIGAFSAAWAGVVVRKVLRRDFELRALVREREQAPRRF